MWAHKLISSPYKNFNLERTNDSVITLIWITMLLLLCKYGKLFSFKNICIVYRGILSNNDFTKTSQKQ